MKKTIVFVMLVMLPAAVFSQQTTIPAPAIKTDYLQKSKKQKTAANIMLYSGGGFFLVGSILITKEYDDFWIGLFGGDEKYNSTGAEVFLWTGLVSMAGSIPLFIASGRNRRKAVAANVSIDIKKSYRAGAFTVKSSAYPALTLKLSL